MMLAKRKTISFQELWFSTVPSRFSARHTGFTGFLINVCKGHMMLRSVRSFPFKSWSQGFFDECLRGTRDAAKRTA